MKRYRYAKWMIGLLLLVFPAVAVAENKKETDKDPKTGIHLRSGFATRLVPTGLRLKTTGGFRQSLTDSQHLLLKDTYVETGVTTEITPSNGWAGAYVEILPLALLKLRASVQSLHYFGMWGYLHDPGDLDDPKWTQDQVKDDTPMAGQAATGVMYNLEATPRAKVGPVVFQAPTMYRRVEMNVDKTYYESSFDFLMEPTDSYWKTQPTLGYVFQFEKSDSWLLAAARWQHAETLGTNIKRDLPLILTLWKLPWQPLSWGEMKLAVLGGMWTDAPHPNRDNTGYVAAELSIEELFGF